MPANMRKRSHARVEILIIIRRNFIALINITARRIRQALRLIELALEAIIACGFQRANMLSSVRKRARRHAIIDRGTVTAEILIIPHVALEEITGIDVLSFVPKGDGTGVVTLVDQGFLVQMYLPAMPC